MPSVYDDLKNSKIDKENSNVLSYWEKRKVLAMHKDVENAEIVAQTLADIYLKSSLYLTRNIDKIYLKYASDNNLTRAEALMLLEHVNPNASVKDNLKEITNLAISDKIKDRSLMLETKAYRYRINLLEQKIKQIDEVMNNLYIEGNEIITEALRNKAKEVYDRTLEDIERQEIFLLEKIEKEEKTDARKQAENKLNTEVEKEIKKVRDLENLEKDIQETISISDNEIKNEDVKITKELSEETPEHETRVNIPYPKAMPKSYYEKEAAKMYDRTIEELKESSGISFNYATIDDEQIKDVLSMNWSGSNYSKRLWNNTEELANDLKRELIVNLIAGKTVKETEKFIKQKYQVGAYEAKRLVRTEMAFVTNELDAIAYEAAGIDKYVYLAILDLKTSKICRKLDGKVFDVKDRKTGVNFPPMHPFCRSTTIAYIDEEELSKTKRSGLDEEGNRIIIDWSNYEDWYNKHGKKLEDNNKIKSKIQNDNAKQDNISVNDYKTKNIDKNKEKNSRNDKKYDKIVTGARITDLESKRAKEFAEQYYNAIRKSKTDVKRISDNIGVNIEDIQKIKNYLFMDNAKYNEDKNVWERFDSDCAIAQSWQRLMLGKDIKKHDLTLINHELEEMKIKKLNPNITHNDAHEIASKKYNYTKESNEYYDNIKQHKKT